MRIEHSAHKNFPDFVLLRTFKRKVSAEDIINSCNPILRLQP